MREKTDKRSRKTVRTIQNTLLALLCERRSRDIKIVDLCTRADLNRTTFYLHFSDIEDVLQSLRDEISDRIFTESEALIDFAKPSDPLPFLNVCTEVLGSYEKFSEFLQHGPDADLFLSGLKGDFTRKLFERYTKKGGEAAEDTRFLLLFLTTGVLDVYVEWLKSGQTVPFSSVMNKCAPLVEAGLTMLAAAIDATTQRENTGEQ